MYIVAYLPSSCLANLVKRAEQIEANCKQLSFVCPFLTPLRKEKKRNKKERTSAQVRYLCDFFLLVNQFIERSEDAKQLLHLVGHRHSLQDLWVEAKLSFVIKPERNKPHVFQDLKTNIFSSQESIWSFS